MFLSFANVMLVGILNTMSSYSSVSGPARKGVGESLRALTEMRRMFGMRAGMKWTQGASLRRGGARGGVIPGPSGQQPARAVGSGSSSGGAAAAKRGLGGGGTKHPRSWRLQGTTKNSEFLASQNETRCMPQRESRKKDNANVVFSLLITTLQLKSCSCTAIIKRFGPIGFQFNIHNTLSFGHLIRL